MDLYQTSFVSLRGGHARSAERIPYPARERESAKIINKWNRGGEAIGLHIPVLNIFPEIYLFGWSPKHMSRHQVDTDVLAQHPKSNTIRIPPSFSSPFLIGFLTVSSTIAPPLTTSGHTYTMGP